MLCCAIFTTKSLAQSRPEMVVILDNTVNHIQRNALKVQFNATQIDSTFPSQTLLWRINSFPFNMTINGITYQINNIGDAVERGKNQPGMSSSSSNYDIAIPNFGQPQPCPFGIDGQDDNTLLPFCNSLINTIPDITCAVKVAILDTGVDPIFSLIPFIGGSYSFISPSIVFPVPCTFNNYHGTKVASVMTHYLKKISGSSIISIKVLDDCGQGTVFDAIRGIDKANLLNVDIINMSFIGQDEVTANQKTPLEVAIDLAKDNNILAVEAAGNEDINIDYRPIYQKTITTVGGTSTTNYKVAYPPASLENTNSIVVGSYSCDMKKSNFSNYGKVSVDIYAPGEFVLTRDGLNIKKYSSGTSFATPIVAGIAALLKCTNHHVDSLKKATLSYGKTIAKAVYIAPDTTKNFTFLSGSQPVMKNEIIDVSINNVTCHNACNGAITIKVKGNTKPYNYKWGNNSIIGTNLFSISGLCAGVHCVTITDELNCPIETCITITEPPALSINTTSNATCFGQCTGSISVTASGGTAPYQYQWSNLANSSNINGLCAGNYTCTVTDANGCTQSVNVTVTAPAPLNLTPSVSNILCHGQCNGSISVTTSGGTAPYQYQWSNLANSSNINGLCAGNYACTVTDANGCRQSVNVTVTQPAPLNLTSNVSNVICNGQCNGSISVTTSGGTAPYQYEWSNLANSSNINGLCAGNYTCTVTDANGCSKMSNVTITAPAAVTVSVGPDITLNGVNTSITLTAISNASTYLWNTKPAQTTSSIIVSPTVTTTYIVTVTNGNGCTARDAVLITVPVLISTSYAVAFANPIINGNKLRVDIKMSSPNLFYIGSCNFRFNYNNNALSNLSVVSSNFPTPMFNTPTLVGSNPNTGIASVNVVYNGLPNTNMIPISSIGQELITLEFDIINPSLPSGLVWRTNISPAPYNTIPRCTVLDDDKVSVIPIINFANLKDKIQIAAITALESDNCYLATINFPLSDPYAAAPFNTSFQHINNGPLVTTTSAVLAQTGSNAIVDWIFIELRTGISGSTTVAYTQAGLLKKDGNIVSADGVSPLYFPNAVTGNYYVAVRHRNHLGFRTNNPVVFGLAPVALNFTNNSVPLYGINPISLNGRMIGGDANFDGSIDSIDSAIWEAQNGNFDDYFLNADYNLDGSIDGPDSGIWETHNGKYQELD